MYRIAWDTIFPDKRFLNLTKISNVKSNYANFFSIKDMFKISGVGITTAHDDFVIASSVKFLKEKFLHFKHSKRSHCDLHNAFKVKEKMGWSILKAWDCFQNIDKKEIENNVKNITYRPFDNKKILYHPSVVWRTAQKVMQHMLTGDNIGLVSVRQINSYNWYHSFVSDIIVESAFISNKTAEMNYLYPLYLYQNNQKTENISQLYLKDSV